MVPVKDQKGLWTEPEKGKKGSKFVSNFSNVKRYEAEFEFDGETKLIKFRSVAEYIYAVHLDRLRRIGRVYKWKYETKTFWFEKIRRGATSYKPDFQVWVTEGDEYEWREVKGYLSPKDKTKLKRMALYYPDEKIVLIGQKEINELKKIYSKYLKTS